MFIAGGDPNFQRRTEERELVGPMTTSSLPLLRTAPGVLFVPSYKHLTPAE